MEIPNPVEHKKFVRQKIEKYGLVSQRKVPAFKAERLLRENGFVLTDGNKNCLFCNNGSESIKHWLVKAIIFKILRERGRTVGTEVEVDKGIVDVFDVDNRIAYEVETNLTREKILEKLQSYPNVRDIFFIDTREISDDFYEAEKYLQEKIV